MKELSEERGFGPGRRVGAPEPKELFLDFDPVFPGWPPVEEPPPKAVSDRSGKAHETAPLITVRDFLRLRTAGRGSKSRRCCISPNPRATLTSDT